MDPQDKRFPTRARLPPPQKQLSVYSHRLSRSVSICWPKQMRWWRPHLTSPFQQRQQRCLWFGCGLTPLDVMVRWKMSCHLMEEPPVAAGRSVATGAMCVNLLPCHFSPPPIPLPLHLCLSFLPSSLSSPSLPPTPWTPLPLPTVVCDKLLLAADLLVVKSVPLVAVKGRMGGRGLGEWWGAPSLSPPRPPTTPHHPILPAV